MEDDPADTTWTSRFIHICVKVCVPKWLILFSGALAIITGFTIGAVMSEELTGTAQFFCFFTGIIGAFLIVLAITLFGDRENPQEPTLELREGQFYINGREAGTLERNQAIRRDPRRLPQLWEPRVRDYYSGSSSPTNSESSDSIFTDVVLKRSPERVNLREDKEDAKSVSTNASEITMLVDEIEA